MKIEFHCSENENTLQGNFSFTAVYFSTPLVDPQPAYYQTVKK